MCCLACAAPKAVPYTSGVTDSLFYFVNQRKTFADAQKMCTTLGGHLASYSSVQEQVLR